MRNSLLVRRVNTARQFCVGSILAEINSTRRLGVASNTYHVKENSPVSPLQTMNDVLRDVRYCGRQTTVVGRQEDFLRLPKEERMNTVPVDTSTTFHTTKTGQRIEKESGPHYHVVEFINGCTNDYDSGPYEELEDAQSDLEDMVESHNENALWLNENGYHDDPYTKDGDDRYTRNAFILKIEECRETKCLEEYGVL